MHGDGVRESLPCMHDSSKTALVESNGQNGTRSFTRNMREETLLMEEVRENDEQGLASCDDQACSS
jgi:hypothetical protein